MKTVFSPLSPKITRRQIPRILFQRKEKREKKILYAPSHGAGQGVITSLYAIGLFDQEFSVLLRDNNLSFLFRPHPLTYEAMVKEGISLPEGVLLETSDDIHDSLSSFGLVITDYSGLIIDCWEMEIESACICDDLEEVFFDGKIFDWFYQRLNSNRFANLHDAVVSKLGGL
jgi:hypothetical protein